MSTRSRISIIPDGIDIDRVVDTYGQIFSQRIGLAGQSKRVHESNIAMSNVYPWFREAVIAGQDSIDKDCEKLMMLLRLRRGKIRADEQAAGTPGYEDRMPNPVGMGDMATKVVAPAMVGPHTKARDKVANFLLGYLLKNGDVKGWVDISYGLLAYTLGMPYATVYNAITIQLESDGLSVSYDARRRSMYVDATNYVDLGVYRELYSNGTGR